MENNFDPNAAAVADSGIYGLPCTAEEAQIIIIPVEWELTTSYNRGTVDGPATIMEASLQVDLCHHDYPDLWQKGIWMDEFPKELRELHDEMAPLSEEIINAARIRIVEILADAMREGMTWNELIAGIEA